MEATVLTSRNCLEVLNSHEGTTIIHFWTPWCSSCTAMTALLEQIADENSELTLYKCNADDELQLSTRLCVASVPTLVMLKGKDHVTRLAGSRTKEEILQFISR